MDPAALPLKDIHLPAPVGWWPLAPGWWLLLAIGVAVIVVSVWLGYRRGRLLRLARRLLADVRRQWQRGRDDQQMLAGLSQTLRRAAIATERRAQVAALTASPWRDYLNDGLAGAPFSSHPGSLLIDAAYRADVPQLDDATVSHLFTLVEQRVRQWSQQYRERR
ncbi:MAG: DUF4381 domain-containing protein [Pseudomonadota bacterium]